MFFFSLSSVKFWSIIVIDFSIIVFDYFKKVFKNCERKIQIKYKRTNEKIRRVYLDLIVSNETTVYIIEIKRGCLDTNEEQINLYFDLIYYLLKSKNDKRKCYATFLVIGFIG